MTKHRRILAALAVALLLAAILAAIPKPKPGVKFAMSLGTGWNLANTLDAYGLGYGAGAPAAYETYWGNEPVTQRQIDAIRAAGFRTLRIPVTWFEHLDAENRIDPAWLNRVQAVVDMALQADLYVIVNAHHDAWYTPDPAGLTSAQAAMRTVWGQIAARFADYDTRLLFESMNEPRLIGHDEEWSAGTPEARQAVNRLNATFVDTVRQSGGQNAARYLLLPAYAASIREEALTALALPNDPRVIVSAHLYAPYAFALDEAGTSDWSETRQADAEEITEAFRRLKQLFVARGIPVVVTEFGAVDKGNESARAAWAAFVLRLAKDAGIPCLWWDTSLMDKHTFAIHYPRLLTALLH